MKKIQAIFIGLFLTISSVANAVIVDNSSFTTDTASGLDWLDLTPTLGKTYFQVNGLLQSGQAYSGWSFATDTQLEGLVSNFTGFTPASNANSSTNPNLFDGLITLFGGQTFAGKSANIYGAKGLIGDTAFGSLFQVKSFERFNDSPVYGTYTQANNVPDSVVGAFLVRPTKFSLTNPATSVPEPETYAMFLAGLGLLGFAKRRKH